MSNKVLLTISILASLFVGCSDSNSVDITEDETSTTALSDITLSAGDSKVCTTATKFTVTPTNDPVVTFTTDADSGDTTIALSADTTGSVTISNCTL